MKDIVKLLQSEQDEIANAKTTPQVYLELKAHQHQMQRFKYRIEKKIKELEIKLLASRTRCE